MVSDSFWNYTRSQTLYTLTVHSTPERTPRVVSYFSVPVSVNKFSILRVLTLSSS